MQQIVIHLSTLCHTSAAVMYSMQTNNDLQFVMKNMESLLSHQGWNLILI